MPPWLLRPCFGCLGAGLPGFGAFQNPFATQFIKPWLKGASAGSDKPTTAPCSPDWIRPDSFLEEVAEREGFEPPVPCGTAVFKTAAIDHSAISPMGDKGKG